MIVSIETPVFKGGWLIPCIESVLAQTSVDWRFTLAWDGGDELSKNILQKVEKLNHPKIKVYYNENRGIAGTRRFLTDRSKGEYILALDDDDLLAPDAVEAFLEAAESMPWAGIIRAGRRFIDERGKPVDMEDWFPFKARQYFRGMTTDLYNHSQPALIKRTAYEQTSGWEGFEEYLYAGADCDIFTRIEEVAPIELLDRRLYNYRIHEKRASNELGDAAADDMWRRLADRAIQRRGLPLKRENETQPFVYSETTGKIGKKEELDIVIPFWEADEKELPYKFNRPSNTLAEKKLVMNRGVVFRQSLESSIQSFDRIEIACSSSGPVNGALKAAFFSVANSFSPACVIEKKIEGPRLLSSFLSMDLEKRETESREYCRMEVTFTPRGKNRHSLWLHLMRPGRGRNRSDYLRMRLFRKAPAYSRSGLDRCLLSLRKTGLSDDSIHIIEKRQSSAANRNEGVKCSSKPYLCFLDDDVEIVDEHIFETLFDKLLEFKADLAGPKILNGKGDIYCADPYFDEKRRPRPGGLGERDSGQYNYSGVVPWLPSTFLLSKREVFRAAGGFDEEYKGSQMEDVDFCLKARSRGFICCYAGDASVKHFNCERNNNFAANYGYFRKRWARRERLFKNRERRLPRRT